MKTAIFSALAVLLLASFAAAQECPFGETDCTGLCGRFTDTNNDGLCDYSGTGAGDALEPVTQISAQGYNGRVAGQVNGYNVIEILLLVGGLYGASWALAKKGFFSIVAHRKIWNLVLLVFFIVAAFLGLMLAIRISYGLQLPNYPNALFIHVEAGIAMAAISIFHVLWHWKYYASFLRRKSCE